MKRTRKKLEKRHFNFEAYLKANGWEGNDYDLYLLDNVLVITPEGRELDGRAILHALHGSEHLPVTGPGDTSRTRVIYALRELGVASPAEVAARSGVTLHLARNHLHAQAKKGLIEKVGRGKYRLPEGSG